MKFIYTPSGADPREWSFHPDRLLSPECIAIERLTGMTFEEWYEQFTNGSVTGIHALLFVLLKRNNPTLKPDEVQFTRAEVMLEPDDEDKRAILEGLLTKPEVQRSDDERGAIEHLRGELGLAADEAPKAGGPPTSNESATTSGPSRTS